MHLSPLLLFTVCLYVFPYAATGQKPDPAPTCSLEIDGAREFQRMDGFGVNANTRSWIGDDLKPAVDLLLDSMHASIWRVITETVEKWEDVNDNADPNNFNWDYYDRLYETPKFQRAWGLMKYLNDRGITDNLMLNFMGPIPLWMGGEKVNLEQEDEYVEMLVSFFYYARNTKHLRFGLISIMNEPDIHKEGPTVDPQQYVRLLKKVILRMKALGMGDLKYVAPDVAGLENGIERYIPALMADTMVMARIAHFGLHSYGGYYAHVDSALTHSAYPHSTYWLTEWNAWRDGLDDGLIGVYDYAFARECMVHLISLLSHGATAAIEWEGYDSYYEHHAPSIFSYWGILGFDPVTKKYTPRKHFYAIAQLFKFVKPGSYRIAVSEPGNGLKVIAFKDPLNNVVLMGINTLDHPMTLQIRLLNTTGITHLEMRHTSATDNLQKDDDLHLSGQEFQGAIPADCIFTLTGKTGSG